MSETSVVLIVALVVILAIVKTTVDFKLRGRRGRQHHKKAPRGVDDTEIDFHATDGM